MDSREDLPRISVGNVQDWQRLKVKYQSAAMMRLEEHILANRLGNERDALIAYMNQLIDHTFRIAQPNLRINGHNYESLDQSGPNMEPFDEALDRRIWSLADTRLQWQKRIGETRRKLPIDIEVMITHLLKGQLMADVNDMLPETADVIQEEDKEDAEPLPHYPQVAEGFQRALALGQELDQMLSSQDERAERVRDVSTEVKALKT